MRAVIEMVIGLSDLLGSLELCVVAPPRTPTARDLYSDAYTYYMNDESALLAGDAMVNVAQLSWCFHSLLSRILGLRRSNSQDGLPSKELQS